MKSGIVAAILCLVISGLSPLSALAQTDAAAGKSDDMHQRAQATAACVPSDTLLCLHDGRFSVSVSWRDQAGQTGVGHVLPAESDDSGMFWFFSADNWELLVKVLNGCAITNHYWVFFAATTDQEFTVTVTDLSAGKVVDYTNPLKNPADAVTDTTAFNTCP